MNLGLNIPSPISAIPWKINEELGIELYLKRDDLVHPWIQGNKWRKLKYSLLDLKSKGLKRVISPGGAFSNHLMALGAVCQREELDFIALVRGEEDPNNPNLKKLSEFGATLKFISRENFKYFHAYIDSVHPEFPGYYFIPEGGTNMFALKGVAEIISEIEDQMTVFPDYIVVPMGTAGTFAGLLSVLPKQTKLVGISAFSSYSFETILTQLLNSDLNYLKDRYEIIERQELGRFAKMPEFLLAFIKDFYEEFQIMLDPVYTGKMMWTVQQLIRQNYFKQGSKILAIHTGGLQGWIGFNYRYPDKKGLIYCPY